MALYIDGQFTTRKLTIFIFCVNTSPKITRRVIIPSASTCLPIKHRVRSLLDG